MTVRLASEADLPALTALVEDYACEVDPGGVAFESVAIRRSLRLLVAAPRAAVWIAERGGEPVGICAAELSVARWSDVILAELVILFVRSVARGGVVPARLLGAFEAWASGCGARHLGITDTGAVLGPVLQRRGWRPVETRYLRCI